ncbi:hypothetical protein MAPG_05449 [Magnaporthiopsis poae ATCC 64411]|uniref:Uncharacterized protein n=1 Tax=Magnaporthiopsis poae (strain ATCC 64411 / 73-15) TaxID=644358 RepID=A0A0C4DZE9_MAGP6|nr:hypothetical protein MAPG_05449 [Magnaporthiopsis poae ATCC 64411]
MEELLGLAQSYSPLGPGGLEPTGKVDVGVCCGASHTSLLGLARGGKEGVHNIVRIGNGITNQPLNVTVLCTKLQLRRRRRRKTCTSPTPKRGFPIARNKKRRQPILIPLTNSRPGTPDRHTPTGRDGSSPPPLGQVCCWPRSHESPCFILLAQAQKLDQKKAESAAVRVSLQDPIISPTGWTSRGACLVVSETGKGKQEMLVFKSREPVLCGVFFFRADHGLTGSPVLVIF